MCRARERREAVGGKSQWANTLRLEGRVGPKAKKCIGVRKGGWNTTTKRRGRRTTRNMESMAPLAAKKAIMDVFTPPWWLGGPCLWWCFAGRRRGIVGGMMGVLSLVVSSPPIVKRDARGRRVLCACRVVVVCPLLATISRLCDERNARGWGEVVDENPCVSHDAARSRGTERASARPEALGVTRSSPIFGKFFHR
jgi:hypothetical protein